MANKRDADLLVMEKNKLIKEAEPVSGSTGAGKPANNFS
jgi:hypothetical protein